MQKHEGGMKAEYSNRLSHNRENKETVEQKRIQVAAGGNQNLLYSPPSGLNVNPADKEIIMEGRQKETPIIKFGCSCWLCRIIKT